MGHIRNLGLLLKSPGNFQRGLDALRSFPSYRRIDDYASSHGESHNIVACLTLMLGEGIIATGAAAWLVQRVMQDSAIAPMFSSFSGKYGAIHSAHNSMLHKWHREEAIAAAADHTSSVSGSGGGLQHPSSTAGMSRTETHTDASAPYKRIVRVSCPGEPVALTTPRSTKASSALAQEAEHQDMQSMLQSTLEDYAQIDVPALPTRSSDCPSTMSASAVAHAKLLSAAKKKANTEAQLATNAAKVTNSSAKKASKKATLARKTAQDVGQAKGKMSAVSGSSTQPIVIDYKQ